MDPFHKSLSPVKPGMTLREVLTPERFNALAGLGQSAVMGDNLRLGPGLRLRRGPTGMTLALMRKPPNVSTVTQHPWKVLKTGALTVRVTPGSVNGRLPSNWSSELTVPADQDGGYIIWLEATLTSGGTVMSSLVYDAGDEVPTVDHVVFENSEAPGTLYKPLAVVYSGAESITQVDQIETLSFMLTRKTIAMNCGVTSYQMEWTT